MSAWNLIKGLHREVFRRIQLLEEASLDLLSKKTAYKKNQKLHEDFIKFFRVGVIQHFKVEETTLFPILRRNFKESEKLISELISEHKIMVDKYFKLRDINDFKLKRTKDLTNLLKELSTHAQKEERFLPPYIKRLSEKDLREIDELVRGLGYPV
jgi:iron-sulfur cluster repair protein YtfE (RIC family)